MQKRRVGRVGTFCKNAYTHTYACVCILLYLELTYPPPNDKNRRKNKKGLAEKGGQIIQGLCKSRKMCNFVADLYAPAKVRFLH